MELLLHLLSVVLITYLTNLNFCFFIISHCPYTLLIFSIFDFSFYLFFLYLIWVFMSSWVQGGFCEQAAIRRGRKKQETTISNCFRYSSSSSTIRNTKLLKIFKKNNTRHFSWIIIKRQSRSLKFIIIRANYTKKTVHIIFRWHKI